jgi:Utp8 family
LLQKKSSVAIDVRSGTIFQLSNSCLTVKNKSSSETYQLPGQFDDIHILSKSHVLLTFSKGLLIFDTVYGTIQAELAKAIHFITVVNTVDPLSFHAIVTSINETLSLPITIPATASLLDAIDKDQFVDMPSKVQRILIPPKTDLKAETQINTAVQTLSASLKEAADANDSEKFDKLFKEFRRNYKAHKGSNLRKRVKLSPLFVREILGLIFERRTEGLSMRFYPVDTLKFLLEVDIFLRDLLPGGAEGFVSAVMGNKKFLTMLLQSQPTPFTYRDYLVLLQYILDAPVDKRIIEPNIILDAFERDAENFFDRPDMRSVLSTDHLQRLLHHLTQDPDIIPYPALLSAVLNSTGLGPLILTQSLPTDLLDTLHTTLESESTSLTACVETSSIISLILQRQKNIPDSDKHVAYGKRNIDQTGWLDVVAEEGGMTRQRRAWMKKPAHPGAGKHLTHRFVATAKFQEVGAYSLDRMIM